MENNISRNNISVSVLGVDGQKEFLQKVKEVCTRNNLKEVIIHYDIMDEIFVPNRGVDYETVKIAHDLGFFTDVHLMVEEPMKYISKVEKLGANSITVHYEIENLCQILTHLNRLKIQRKIANVGIAIKPGTDISNLHEYLYLVDMILIMSVEPGKGGQSYIKEVNQKLIGLKANNKILQVDGGVNIDTIVDAKESGATSFVVGSYLTRDINKFEENLLNIYKLKD